MPRKKRAGINTMRREGTRFFACLILVLFIVIFLTAQIIIIANANHECIGDGCPICKQVDSAKTLLKQVGKTGIDGSVFLSALFFCVPVMMIIGLLCRHSFSLIQKKVRLNF